jgi:succinate dehydrogenase / fumarate reductase flavoprotein subunit
VLLAPLGSIIRREIFTSSTIPDPDLSTAEVAKLGKEIFAPLGIKDGYDPYDAIRDIQEVLFKFKNSYVKRKDRLEKALAQIEEIKAKLPNLMAKDSHELVRCHEAKAMVTNAELLYEASLMRTETRGSNIREDYPERDDKNWLKWIIIRKEDGKMKLWTEPIPIDKYKYRPE